MACLLSILEISLWNNSSLNYMLKRAIYAVFLPRWSLMPIANVLVVFASFANSSVIVGFK